MDTRSVKQSIRISRCAGQGSRRLAAALIAAVITATLAGPAGADSPTPGGFVESATSQQVRSKVVPTLPARGPFNFPAPYKTRGVRLTNASDCKGADCLHYVGYSYWRNMNNHIGSNAMLVFLSLDRQHGGGGPTLFSYDKTTDQVTVLGPMFDASHPLSWATGEGWYWSLTEPTKLYVNEGAKLERYDVLAKTFETVFDASATYGADKYIWQMHSSADDRMHSATLRATSNYATLGCVVYDETAGKPTFFPAVGDFDECQIDDSGRWLLIKENVDGKAGEDNVIIDLSSGDQSVFLDQAGAAGHSDNGHGYMLAADNWYNEPGAIRLWTFGPGFPAAQPGAPAQGLLVYRTTDWSAEMNHVSHQNARPGIPAAQQYACGSGASRVQRPRANEIQCFPLDGSLRVLVVAPVMTDLDAPGGGTDDYSKLPKGNLDITGRYFIWTSNVGGNRLDAFIVKVPAELLSIAPSGSGAGADATPSLAAAILPSSRSVAVGDTAVVMATVINGGAGTGKQCGISPATSIPATLSYQATKPATNAAIGKANTPVDIGPGATQNFIVSVTANEPVSPTDIALTFKCAAGAAAPVLPGVNTLTFSASSTPVPDIIALSATVSQDGIVTLPGATGSAAFAVAVVNLGDSGAIRASADTGAGTLPIAIQICQTNATTGRCLSGPAASVTPRINTGQTSSFAVFVQGHGSVPFDPASNRIVVRFRDSTGSIRGETSVAVRTQ